MTTPAVTCPHCGSDAGTDPGCLRDNSHNQIQALRRMPGEPEFGVFGGLRTMGRDQLEVSATRCRGCGVLTLFVR